MLSFRIHLCKGGGKWGGAAILSMRGVKHLFHSLLGDAMELFQKKITELYVLSLLKLGEMVPIPLLHFLFFDVWEMHISM